MTERTPDGTLEELTLVTCGRESIRFWRVKGGRLPGTNVALEALAKDALG